MNTAAGNLVTPEVAATLIQSGKFYYCAADEKLLELLPAGNWIGGTIPYFMGDNGGETTREKIYIQEIPTSSDTPPPSIIDYGPAALSHMLLDAPENGFSIILLPANSQVHADFAENAPSYDNMYMKPLIGWVTGFHLDDMGSATPKVINGTTKKFYDNSALVIHCPLPTMKQPLSILSIYLNQTIALTLRLKSLAFLQKIVLLTEKSITYPSIFKSIISILAYH